MEVTKGGDALMRQVIEAIHKSDVGTYEQAAGVAVDQTATPRPVVTSRAFEVRGNV